MESIFFLSVASSFEISVVCFNNLNKVTDIFVYELHNIFDPFLYHSQFGLQTIMHVAIAWILLRVVNVSISATRLAYLDCVSRSIFSIDRLLKLLLLSLWGVPSEPSCSTASLKSTSLHASSSNVHRRLNMPREKCSPGMQTY